MENSQREKEIYKVTLAGSAINVALLVFKFVAGILARSSAMTADAVHSLSDFVTDMIVIIFVKISSKPDDEDHTYGHGKYETLATTIIGLLLGGVAVGIIVKGAVMIADWVQGGELESPGMLALWAALASIILKELVYQYTVRKGRQIDSPVVVANAWHHRSDALSSVGTLIGIGGAILLGRRWTVLDPLASIIVGAMIMKVAIRLLKDGLDELMEKSLPPEDMEKILAIVREYPDVEEPHHLRTRRIGSISVISMHFRMDGEISLRMAHTRTSQIERRLKQEFGADTIVNIHVEPIKRPGEDYLCE
ncbi:MAG: cation diffusion facilitator family transporter [Bacteroidales bacterium]|nr:cation diffusion facilitator family transporter [Bacteroidales bacterium]